MNQLRRMVCVLLAVTVLSAGCGSATRQASSSAAPPAARSLATAMATAGGTWAVVVMGGSAAQHDNFWQLFARPAGTASWRPFAGDDHHTARPGHRCCQGRGSQARPADPDLRRTLEERDEELAAAGEASRRMMAEFHHHG